MKPLLPMLGAACLLLIACSQPAGKDQDGNPPPWNPAACREEITADITVNTTLSHGFGECDYYISNRSDGQSQIVRISADLMIDPGTVIIVDKDVILDIDAGGSINAIGTAEAPVILTGRSETPGYWYGLCFDANRESRLDHVNLLWAGKVWSGGSKVCDGAISGVTGSGEPVHITNSLVFGSDSSGVSAFGFELGEFSSNVLAGNRDYGLRVKAEYASRLDGSSDFSGITVGADALNGRPYVFVSGLLNDGQSHTWRNLNAPYFTGDDYPFGSNIYGSDGSKLTIEPGTRHIFGPEGSIFMTDGASFTANGTAEEPIIFAGEEAVAGYWEGLQFLNAEAVQLQHVEVSWGGYGDEFELGAGNVVIWGESLPGGAELHEVILEGSSSCGLNISSSLLEQVNGTELTFSGNAKQLCVDGVEQ